MTKAQRFPYVEINPGLGAASSLPYVPLILKYQENEVSLSALVDSGSALNVLPYSVGLKLGAVWDQQTVPVKLTGNLKDSNARAIILMGKVGQFAPVRLAFAWTRNDEVPIIVGQVNFFMEFDVSFSRSRFFFEIEPRKQGAD